MSRNIALGISYSDHARSVVCADPGLVDFIEVPFELLCRAPERIEEVLSCRLPVILHCSSLSLAGNARPGERLIQQLEKVVDATNTPWIGEHLAFISCEQHATSAFEHEALVLATGSEFGAELRFDVGYTVSPQMSEEVVERVIRNVAQYEERFGRPMLLENGPLYFVMPGSSMSQTTFIKTICDRKPDQRLLVDLVHLQITCNNQGLCVYDELRKLPMERVDEVHMSGYSVGQGLWWDDHSTAANDDTFKLLESLLTEGHPKSVTLEYNWGDRFGYEVFQRDLSRTRQILAGLG